MIPKNTATTVSLPPEKPLLPSSPEKTSTVVYMDSGYTAKQDSPVRIKQAKICACAVVLTTLILVTGTLGAITIILTYTSRGHTGTEPSRDSQFIGKTSMLPDLPESNPQIKIDDGGLWPPKPMTPDLVTAITGKDDDIHFEEVGNNEGTGGDNEILVAEEEIDQISDSSSSFKSSSDDYENGRTYISSSFPFGGFYMRGGVGIPPWEESSGKEMSGSGSGDGDETQGDDGNSSGWRPTDTGASSPDYSSESDSVGPNIFSDMYYDS